MQFMPLLSVSYRINSIRYTSRFLVTSETRELRQITTNLLYQLEVISYFLFTIWMRMFTRSKQIQTKAHVLNTCMKLSKQSFGFLLFLFKYENLPGFLRKLRNTSLFVNIKCYISKNDIFIKTRLKTFEIQQTLFTYFAKEELR